MPSPESIRVCRRGVRSVKEAAKFLGVSRALVWQLIRAERFTVIRWGKLVLIPVTELNEFIAEKRDESLETVR